MGLSPNRHHQHTVVTGITPFVPFYFDPQIKRPLCTRRSSILSLLISFPFMYIYFCPLASSQHVLYTPISGLFNLVTTAQQCMGKITLMSTPTCEQFTPHTAGSKAQILLLRDCWWIGPEYTCWNGDTRPDPCFHVSSSSRFLWILLEQAAGVNCALISPLSVRRNCRTQSVEGTCGTDGPLLVQALESFFILRRWATSRTPPGPPPVRLHLVGVHPVQTG